MHFFYSKVQCDRLNFFFSFSIAREKLPLLDLISIEYFVLALYNKLNVEENVHKVIVEALIQKIKYLDIKGL